jgi:hypothetical protein
MRGWPVALLILLWLAGPAARAQAPAWARLSTAGAGNSDAFSYVLATAADAASNVYLAGQFTGTVSFGLTVLTSNATAASFVTDGFLAKWNSSTSTFGWAVALTGSGADAISAVAVSNGAVYVAGNYSGGATFGSSSIAGQGGVFVAKLTDAGSGPSLTWAKSANSSGIDLATGLAVRGSNVYLAGSFTGLVFNADNTTISLPAGNLTDVFVAKLADAGPTASFVWSQGFGDTGSDEARALAVSGNSVYVLGDFTSPTLGVGSTVLVNADVSGNSPATADVFLVKLIDNGATAGVAWALRAGGTGHDTGDGMAAVGSSVYVAGGFGSGTLMLGSRTLTNASQTANTADVFAAKLTDAGASGSFAWALSGGGIGIDRPKAVAVQGLHVYVSGSYGYPGATFGSTVLTNRGTRILADIFVAKLTDAGPATAFTWAQSAGGVNGESAFGLALTGNSVVAAGGASNLAAFGPLSVPPSSSVSATAFVAALTDPTLLATTAAKGTLRFALSPNPARTTATVQLPVGPGTTAATLTLTDVLGRTLRTEILASPAAGRRHELDLRGLASGFYTVQVQAGSTRGTQRLAIE